MMHYLDTELLAGLSPYLASKIKRYDNYTLDLLTKPLPFEEMMAWSMQFSILDIAKWYILQLLVYN